MSDRCPGGGLPTVFDGCTFERLTAGQKVLFDNLSRAAQADLLRFVFQDSTPIDWSPETIVRLHFLLLDDCEKLADPDTPLEDKLEILEWIYADPAQDQQPFSFVNCMRLLGRSCRPGEVEDDPRQIRLHLRERLRQCVYDTLARYPAWVREAFDRNPEAVAGLLHQHPQRLNETVKRVAAQGDLLNP